MRSNDLHGEAQSFSCIAVNHNLLLSRFLLCINNVNSNVKTLTNGWKAQQLFCTKSYNVSNI